MNGDIPSTRMQKLNSSLDRLVRPFSKSPILELSLYMIAIMETKPHFFNIVLIYNKYWALRARYKQLSRLAIRKMEAGHVWYKISSWTKANLDEIEGFKIGTDLTASVLTHVRGSYFLEITPRALKSSVLSHVLTQLSLDRLCFVGWNEEISENETGKCWLNSQFHPICLKSSSVVLRLPTSYLRISALRQPTVRFNYINNIIMKIRGLIPLYINILLGPYQLTLQATVSHQGNSIICSYYTASANCRGKHSIATMIGLRNAISLTHVIRQLYIYYWLNWSQCPRPAPRR